MKKLFIAFLLLSSVALSFAADYETPAGGAQEGSDVGFGNMTATSLSVTGDITADNITLVDRLTSGVVKANTKVITPSIVTSSSVTLNIAHDRNFTAADDVVVIMGGTTLNEMQNSSGHSNILTIAPRIHQSGTAGYSALFVNVSTITEGSGDKYLIQASNNNDLKFSVDINGSSDTGGAVAFSGISTVTVDYTIGNFTADPTYFIECDAALGNISTTLPPVANKKGRMLEVKLTSASNGCYIDGNGAETIDGVAGKSITTQYTTISLIAGLTEWLIR